MAPTQEGDHDSFLRHFEERRKKFTFPKGGGEQAQSHSWHKEECKSPPLRRANLIYF